MNNFRFLFAFVVALALGPLLLPEFYVTLLNYIGQWRAPCTRTRR